MPPHRSLTPVLEQLAVFEKVPWSEISAPEARALMDVVLPDASPIDDVSVETVAIKCAEHTIEARLYRPQGVHDAAVTLYLHGGGWVVGTLDLYDGVARIIARLSQSAVLMPAYRKAPEAPYPAAVEDSLDALYWLIRNVRQFGFDPDRISVAGDSAGGNLAAATAILAACGGQKLYRQLLLYPAIEPDFSGSSYEENAVGYGLTRDMMKFFWRNYIGDRDATQVPLAALAQVPLPQNLAPAIVLTAAFDPLRDEGNDYARRLIDAGVETELVCIPDMIHGFANMSSAIPAAMDWMRWATARLHVASAKLDVDAH